MQLLIEGGTVEMTADPKMVFAQIKSSPNALYNLLLFSGYLTSNNIQPNEDASYYCEARIPNKEVRGIFSASVQKWVSHKFHIEEDKYSAFISKLLSGEVDVFASLLK